MAVKAKFKRTRLWVDTPFQLRLLAATALYFVVYTVFVWHIGFVIDTLRTCLGQGPMKAFSAAYAEYFWKQWPLILTFFLTTPLFLYDLLKLSHRVAGPLYRCRRVMLEMASGKAVPEFKPRKHDLMRELFAAFNSLITAWNARVAEGANGSPALANPPPCARSETMNPGPAKIGASERQQVQV
jgi:hypothetical protein